MTTTTLSPEQIQLQHDLAMSRIIDQEFDLLIKGYHARHHHLEFLAKVHHCSERWIAAARAIDILRRP